MNPLIPKEVIERKIFFIREQKVMLDRDLATLYRVETRALNQSVRRNAKRFPMDFMFELNRQEIMRVSQIVTSLRFSNRVHAFTEQGIAMLSSVLKSERAIQVNVEIMRAFVKLRRLMSSNLELSKRLNELERKYDGQFKVVFDAIRRFMVVDKKPKRRIGFG